MGETTGTEGQTDAARILAVDDDADLRGLMDMMLTAEGYDVCVVEDPRSVVGLASEFRPDLVLLDVMMPVLDGLEVCRALRSEPTTSAVPIIMLTAKSQAGDAVAGFRAGADDYVTKPFDSEELLARVATTLARSAALRGASPVTGLPGNFEIIRRLDGLVAAPVQDFALLHADLDNFKAFNDHYGFVRGDEAIRATANVLQDVARARPVCFIGHIGGDDFALITPADAAEDAAQAVVEAFDREAPRLYDPADRARGWIEVPDRAGTRNRYRFLGISIGVTSTAQGRFSSVHEVAQAAVEVKALAKQRAESCWCLDRRQRP